MLLLQVDVVKYSGYKINCWITGQTVTGKELSNPLMAGSLLKTTLPTKLIKTVNDDVRLQALIDGKKVVINEAYIRHDLKLNDAEGTSCLSNVVSFEELARMDAKTTLWTEFISTMASTIICLANNQKFNFSKYILDNLKKNLEAGVPFYMFPRFIQVFVNHQLGDMSHYKAKTQADKKKEKKETEVSPTEIHTEDHVPTTSNDPLPGGEDRMRLKELMDLCTKLSNKVLDLENEERKIADIDADAEVNLENVYNLDMAHEETVLSMQDVTDDDVKEVTEEIVEVITIAKIIVHKVSTAGGELNAANEEPAKDNGKVKLVKEPKVLKSRKAQIAIDDKVTRRIEAEWNANMKDNIDWNEVVDQAQSIQSDVVKKYQALKSKHVSLAQARKNMMIYLKNMVGLPGKHKSLHHSGYLCLTN
nr:hypothetical protein [Tanacetum cinerariifolium]